MEAAAIPWRPLGRLLVELGLLTDEELELALAKQQVTGRRLGETIVECGFVSRPDLSNALAAQYGIQLTTETGFGTGLRAQIQQRHESDRGGRVIPIGIAQSAEPAVEIDAEPADSDSPPPAEAMLLAQLEEQWAKLAAAEERLAEQEAALAQVAAERDRRRIQAERLSRRARGARAAESVARERNEELASVTQTVDGKLEEQRTELAAAEQRLVELTADRDRRRAQAVRFVQRVHARDTELQRRNEELTGLAQTADGKVSAQRKELAAAEQRVAELTVDRDRRRAQAVRFVHKVRARDNDLQRRDEELKGLGEEAEGKVQKHRVKLAAAEKLVSEREREIEALIVDRDRRRAQAVGFVRRMRTRDEELARRTEELHGLSEAAAGLRDQVQRLAGDVRGCDAEIERLRSENMRRRAQAARFAARARDLPRASDEVLVATPSSHLVFLQLAGGYELVERDGPPPARHSPLELPDLCDGPLVVAGSRLSPFPGDSRPCVVAQPY